jgi:transposase
MSDIYKHDTHIRGERCGTNKYKTEQIVAFRKDLENGMSVASAARKNQIHRSTAHGIKNKQSWAWL